MYKLTMRGRIILIGLSTSLYLSGSCIFLMDPPDKLYQENFKNISDAEIQIVFISNSKIVENDTIVISPNKTKKRGEFVADDQPIMKNASDFDFFDYTIKLILEDDEIKQEWLGPAGSFGDHINSPFNHDSWLFEALNPDERNVVGKITFTITDDDLN